MICISGVSKTDIDRESSRKALAKVLLKIYWKVLKASGMAYQYKKLNESEL